MKKHEVIEQINQIDDIHKVGMLISKLSLDWTMMSGDKIKKEIENLIDVSVNRLNYLCIINGERHPFQDIDMTSEESRKKIEKTSILTMLHIIVGKEKREEEFNFSMN